MPKMLPIEDVIMMACLGSNDILQQKKMKYLFYAKKVWEDLNFSTIKSATRQVFNINKRTNSINLPCSSLYVSDVSFVDCHGIPHPCFVNQRVRTDIIDSGIGRDCHCGCGKDLCNLIKGYEAVTEVINAEMPDGSFKDFKCITRKDVDSNGWYYEQKQYPQRVYTDGTWTDTVLHIENIQLCQLQLDNKGCVEDCEDNYQKVTDCGCYSKLWKDCDTHKVGDDWISHCGSQANLFSVETGCAFAYNRCEFNNVYNISESGDRLIFPPNFGYDKVLVRFYEDISLENLKVPSIAEACFVMGLKYWETMFDDSMRNLHGSYSQEYTNMKFGLLIEMNKYTLAEWRLIMSPKKYTPSYITDRRNFGDNFFGNDGYYNNNYN